MILHRKNINAADMPFFLGVVLIPDFLIKKYLWLIKKNVSKYFESIFIEPKKN